MGEGLYSSQYSEVLCGGVWSVRSPSNLEIIPELVEMPTLFSTHDDLNLHLNKCSFPEEIFSENEMCPKSKKIALLFSVSCLCWKLLARSLDKQLDLHGLELDP